MEENKSRQIPFKKICLIALSVLMIVAAIVLPVFAWFASNQIAAYAPISSHEAIYIGAGHIEIDGSDFDPDYALEDVRYLYLEGVDLTDEDKDYYDYVFCVYGKSISHFKLQLAYTTNNQFTYSIFEANEEDDPEDFAVDTDIIAHTTHDETNPQTYYYQATGDALAGSYLNKTISDGKDMLSL